jgi:hypothetical protein
LAQYRRCSTNSGKPFGTSTRGFETKIKSLYPAPTRPSRAITCESEDDLAHYLHACSSTEPGWNATSRRTVAERSRDPISVTPWHTLSTPLHPSTTRVDHGRTPDYLRGQADRATVLQSACDDPDGDRRWEHSCTCSTTRAINSPPEITISQTFSTTNNCTFLFQ